MPVLNSLSPKALAKPVAPSYRATRVIRRTKPLGKWCSPKVPVLEYNPQEGFGRKGPGTRGIRGGRHDAAEGPSDDRGDAGRRLVAGGFAAVGGGAGRIGSDRRRPGRRGPGLSGVDADAHPRGREKRAAPHRPGRRRGQDRPARHRREPLLRGHRAAGQRRRAGAAGWCAGEAERGGQSGPMAGRSGRPRPAQPPRGPRRLRAHRQATGGRPRGPLPAGGVFHQGPGAARPSRRSAGC